MEQQGNRLLLNVKFLDVIGQPISHVNYDISVSYNFEPVLVDMGVHSHSGMGQHITAPLTIDKNGNDVVEVKIVFQGIGLQKPYGGPIGKVFDIVEYPNLSP